MSRNILDETHFEFSLPRGRPFQVIGFGENAVDWICRVPRFPQHDTKTQMEPILRKVGGQIATACSLCARYGLSTRYIGRVGDDDLGRFAQEDLGKDPMDLQLEVVADTATHLSLIIVDRPTGGRTIIWDRDPRLGYREGELSRPLFVDGQTIHLDGNDLVASTQVARWAKEAGMRVCLDIDRVQPGVEELLRLTDFLIASRTFISAFGKESSWRSNLRFAASVCPGFVAVTRGSQGAAALWDDEILEFPAFEVEVLDSTGAGDMFHGAFLYGVVQGWTIGRCMRFANAAGALACTGYGARSSIPELSQVLALEQGGVPKRVSLLGRVAEK